jgi:hypothetical protein
MGVNLEGYSEHLHLSMKSFESLFEEAYEHLSFTSKVNPVVQLAMALLSNLVMFALQKRITDSKLAAVALIRAKEEAKRQAALREQQQQQQQRLPLDPRSPRGRLPVGVPTTATPRQFIPNARGPPGTPIAMANGPRRKPSPSLEQKMRYLANRRMSTMASLSNRPAPLPSVPERKAPITILEPAAPTIAGDAKSTRDETRSIYTLGSGTASQTTAALPPNKKRPIVETFAKAGPTPNDAKKVKLAL